MCARFNNWLWRLTLPTFLWLSAPFVCSQTSSTSPRADFEREFQTAMSAEDRGDTNQAEALLTALQRTYPGIFAVDESLGLLYARREDFSRALPPLQAAVREQPSSDVAHANLGATLYRLHRNEAARQEFAHAVRINPGNLSAQESLGRLSMDAHRPEDAAKALLAAQRLKPDDEDLKLDCATALLAANRVDEAQKMLSTVSGVDESARAQSLLGEADEKQGKFQDAGKHFDRAVQLEPNEENAWLLGYEFLRHWTFDAAITEFGAASVKFPESKRLRLGLGTAFFGAQKYERAISVFADLLEGDPDNAMYAELLGISCNAPIDVDSPRCMALVPYAQSHPSDAKAAAYAASSLLMQTGSEQNIDLARKLAQSAVEADPNLPDAQFEMGVILENSKDWKGSIPYLERAVKIRPNYAKAHYRLARAYWKTGRRQDGDAEMELEKKFARQGEEDLERRLNEIVVFSVKVQ